MKPLLVLALLAAVAVGCAAAPSAQVGTSSGCVETPALEPGVEATVVAFKHTTYQDWGTILADAACDGRPVRFEGSGFDGYRRVAIWLQGAGTSWLPGQLENGRVPGGVLLGESDVTNGRVTFTRRFAPAIGPTSDCGTMALTPGARYGWVVVGDGAFSSFLAIDVPPRPCLAAERTPALTVAPEAPCDGAAVTITGEGFAPGAVTLQVWKHYVPAPGEFYSGKAPPREFALGEVVVDASGRFTFQWTAAIDPGRGRYVFRALDRGRTRLTTKELAPCPS